MDIINLMNRRNKIDGLKLMAMLGGGSIAACFFDPQFRGVLEHLNYGNEGARQKARVKLPQMDDQMITAFIAEINRLLKPSGYCFLWVDKYHLCTGIEAWIENTSLQIVDMITWYKGKIGMGYRSRRTCEYLLVLQKTPIAAKTTWSVHNIPDVWHEKVAKNHPHTKPIGLQTWLIAAVTEPEDLVLDPAAGGYSVLEACKTLERDFIGGDIKFGEDICQETDDAEVATECEKEYLPYDGGRVDSEKYHLVKMKHPFLDVDQIAFIF